MLDLIRLTDEYHFCIIHDLASFLAKAFFPTIFDAHVFFETLTKEVVKSAPGHIMVFANAIPHGNELSVQTQHVPNDVFGELGILVKLNPS